MRDLIRNSQQYRDLFIELLAVVIVVLLMAGPVF